MKLYMRENQIGDQGELLVARLFIKHFKWICRLQEVDIGIDAEYEVVDANCNATGKVAKIQVKATSKAFTKGANDFYIEQHHLNYWQSFSLPVVFCYVSLVTDEVLWLCIEPDAAYRTRGSGHKLTMNYPDNLLRLGSKGALLAIANRPGDEFFQALLAGEKLAQRLSRGSARALEWDAADRSWLEQLRSRVNEIEGFCAADRYIRTDAGLNSRIMQIEQSLHTAGRAQQEHFRAG